MNGFKNLTNLQYQEEAEKMVARMQANLSQQQQQQHHHQEQHHQTNTLYGSSLFTNPSTNVSSNTQSRLMQFPLALNSTTMRNQQPSQLQNCSGNFNLSPKQRNNNQSSFTNNNTNSNNSGSSQSNQTANDISLYSPSSSTSLLYHIYDQINLPTEHHNHLQQQQHHQQNRHYMSSNLQNQQHANPQQQYQVTSINDQSHNTNINHNDNINNSSRLSNDFNNFNNFNNINNPYISTAILHNKQQQHQQQMPFTTPANNLNHNISSNSNNNNNIIIQPQSLNQSSYGQPLITSTNLMLDAFVRHSNALGNNTTKVISSNVTRPLSSSGTSSTLSAQSLHNTSQIVGLAGAPTIPNSSTAMPLVYSRQLRQPSHQGNTVSNSKSSSNLASVLETNNSLDLFNSDRLDRVGYGAGIATLHHHHQSNLGIAHKPQHLFSNGLNAHAANDNWKRLNKNARHFLIRYRPLIKGIFFMLTVALGVMLLIKNFMPSTTQHQQINNNLNQASSNRFVIPFSTNNINNNNDNYQYSSIPSILSTSNNNNYNTLEQQFNNNDAAAASSKPTGSSLASGASPGPSASSQASAAAQSESLKSRLLTGEFVLVDQLAINNYSQQTQKSLLAERIVQLLDQVFLDSDVRRFYSRTEVTNISASQQAAGQQSQPSEQADAGFKPPAPGLSLRIECNILLTESIGYAAQMFGIALYESLSRTNDKLANQSSYLVDKNTIKFNTIPDKDLKLGLVPASVLAPQIRKEIGIMGAPSGDNDDNQKAKILGDQSEQQPQQQANNNNLVNWGDWSQWSSCMDKNGQCDPGRLHSRARKCIIQSTAESVDNNQCKLKFGPHEKELEVMDCSQACEQQQQHQAAPNNRDHQAPPAPAAPAPGSPLIVNPQTAPPGLVGGSANDELLQFGTNFANSPVAGKQSAMGAPQSASNVSGPQHQQQLAAGGKLESPLAPVTPNHAHLSPLVISPTKLKQQPNDFQANNNHKQQVNQNASCFNCLQDEICLTQIGQNNSSCLKIKDFHDPKGCGGWCSAKSQLCLQSGPSAFKCVHETECLPDEWRCHDSGCVPLSVRCDGHNNCFDSSDELDCPAPPLGA